MTKHVVNTTYDSLIRTENFSHFRKWVEIEQVRTFLSGTGRI